MSTPTRTIFISGAASGLGAAFLAAYSKQPHTKIIAIDRDPISSANDTTASNSNSQISTYRIDLASEQSLADLSDKLRNQPIDLVIHSAGVRGLVPAIESSQPQPSSTSVSACENLSVMDAATLQTTFNINAIGTFNLLRALLPNLQLSAKEQNSTDNHQSPPQPPKVIIMSSRMGSLGTNARDGPDGKAKSNTAAGGAYAYRASKAATNAIVRSFAVDVPEVAFVLCHPGRVETGLVKWREEGAISAGESVEGLVPLIEGWGSEDSGRFYDRFGEAIPW